MKSEKMNFPIQDVYFIPDNHEILLINRLIQGNLSEQY